MTKAQTHCPICGDALEVGGTLLIGGWKVCSHHWARVKPSKFAGRCHQCLGPVLMGEEVVMSKDNDDARWVILHRRDRCDNTVSIAETAVESGPWDKLFLVPGAPPEVIKAAYRALAQKYHPDKGGDTKRMQEINEAIAKLVK